MSALNPAHYVKAIYAALIAAQGVFVLSIQDRSDGGDRITGNEWGILIFATLVAFIGTYAVTNRGDPDAGRGPTA